MSGLALDLVVVHSSELGAARAFYEAVGLTFVAERHGDGPDHLAATLTDGVVLELYAATAGEPVVRGGVGDVRLGFVVDDFLATVQSVREAGEVITEPTTTHGRHRAVLTGPDGRRVELTAPA